MEVAPAGDTGTLRSGAPGAVAGTGDPPAPAGFQAAVGLGRRLAANLNRVVLGTPGAVTAAAVAALAGGHLLVEDVPGVGKTMLAHALARSLGVALARVQGNPDLLPSDITGVTVYSPDSGGWEFRPGPVFAHVVLVDELNRTPPRTQAALLETMEEHQVSVDGESYPLPDPHLVVATQNPLSQLGTYALVESQLDRFAPAGTDGAETREGDPRQEARAERVARARHKLRQERRRRTLGILVATFVGSLVLGAIPALRPLWDLALVSGLCAVTYVGLLVYFHRMEEMALERERKVVELAALARKGAVVPIRPRPSFVIVEATS